MKSKSLTDRQKFIYDCNKIMSVKRIATQLDISIDRVYADLQTAKEYHGEPANKHGREPAVVPDQVRKIRRPPAVYSNPNFYELYFNS